MSIQRQVRQFRPLVESGYYEHRETKKASPDSPRWPGWETVITDCHVTLRIDVARLAADLAGVAASNTRGTATIRNGAIRLTINTTKERE